MKKLIRSLLIIFALSIMTYSGYKLFGIYTSYAQGDRLYEETANEYATISFDRNKDIEDDKEDNVLEDNINLIVDYQSLLALNKDTIGWIYSEDTPINYPVLQSNDNAYYLHRMLDGTNNIAGSIFMDYRNSPDLSDLTTIIYGHNLKNETMFGTLKEYSNQEYYENHSEIYLSTLEGDYKIDLISGYKTDVNSNVYIIPETSEELRDLYEEVVELSNFEANSSLDEGDRLIILSTCSDGPDTSRYILIGKLVTL